MLMVLLLVFILFALAAFIVYEKFLKCPPELANLPRVSFHSVRDLLTLRVPLRERYEKYIRPLTEQPGYAGACREWFGRWSVIVTEPELSKEIYTKLDRNEGIRKVIPVDFGSFTYSHRMWGINLVFSNGDIWKKQRKIVNPVFNFDYLKELVPVFGQVADLLLKEIGKVDDKPIDIHDWMQRMTLDALGISSFGFDFHALSEGNNATHVSLYNRLLSRVFHPVRFMFPVIDRFNISWNRQLAQDIEAFEKLLFDVIESRKKQLQAAQGNEEQLPKDLLMMMLKAVDDENPNGLTTKELRDNLKIFFLAGHDTSASSLATTLYMLAKYPQQQDTAREEVNSLMEDRYFPSVEDQNKMKFLTACIKESLRFLPPVSLLPRRKVETRVELNDGKLVLPPETPITVSIHAIHHDKNEWGPDCDEWNPQHFLTEKRRHPFAFQPFGAGSRTCIGSNFSLIEQRIVLAMLLRKYEFSIAPGSETFRVGASGLTSPKNMFLSLKRLSNQTTD